jgi:predicted PurR-regulated permease PerM
LGKQLRLNSLAIFLGRIFWFWFWFWGPIGLFLAVPILSVLRIVSAYTPRLKWLGEFLAA